MTKINSEDQILALIGPLYKSDKWIFIQFGDPPADTPDYLHGVAILRDFWLNFEKNRPKELQEIYKKHLEEVEESIRDIWDNRDKILIDLKIIKSWHVRNWKTRTNESLSKIMMHQFKDLGFYSNEAHVFSQLLIEDVSLDNPCQ